MEVHTIGYLFFAAVAILAAALVAVSVFRLCRESYRLRPLMNLLNKDVESGASSGIAVQMQTFATFVPLQQCAICLESCQGRGQGRIELSCKHAFHSACIRSWTAKNRSCPTCRVPIEEVAPPESDWW